MRETNRINFRHETLAVPPPSTRLLKVELDGALEWILLMHPFRIRRAQRRGILRARMPVDDKDRSLLGQDGSIEFAVEIHVAAAAARSHVQCESPCRFIDR